LNFGDNCEKWYIDANRYSKTAIHKAAESGRLDIVALLIDKGANINAFIQTRRNEMTCYSNQTLTLTLTICDGNPTYL